MSMLNVQIKTSLKAKRLRITVHPNGTCIMTVPKFFSMKSAEAFFEKHRAWIESKQRSIQKRGYRPFPRRSRREYLKRKEAVRGLVKERLEHFNAHYTFSYRRISIRNQRSRWGSCSEDGNLSFNYRLIHLSPAEQDYIIVHELCHLREMNHSKNFWALVAQIIPEYKKIRKEIRKISV